MTEVLHANIFFFITAIAVVVFTLLLCVLLFHVIKITQSVRRIVDRIEEGSEVIAEDMVQLRRFFAEGSIVTHLLSMFMGQKKRRKNKKDE
jgi:uncharacterized membrane protein